MMEALEHEVLQDVELGGQTYELAHQFTASDGARAIVIPSGVSQFDSRVALRARASEAIRKLRAETGPDVRA